MRPLFIILALTLTACPALPSPHPPPPDADSSAPIFDPWPFAEGGVPVPQGSTCAQACSILNFVGCPEGATTPNGRTCEDVCETVQSFPGLRLPTACVSKARTIDAVRACGVKCGAH